MTSTPKTTTILAGAALLAIGLAAGFGGARLFTPAGHGPGAAAGAAPGAASGSAPTAAAAASAPGERKVLYWYDPMVPTQRFDKPGKSPFMDMDLVPRYADEGGVTGSGGVAVSPHAEQSLGVRVVAAERRALAPTVDVVGTVALNERDVAIVQARAAGFVERVHGRAPGDVIAAGAPIAELLHPEWLAAQQEYLAVRASGDAVLAVAARQRLVLLGMNEALIGRVEREGRPEAMSTVAAPVGGLVAELMVRQGMTVGAGMTLARINGLATVWVEAAVPEALAGAVQPGRRAEVRLAALPGEVLRGRVTAVLPEARADSRTLRVRIELPNPGARLRAGLVAQVTLHTGAGTPEVVVPAEAVIRTGRRALVYVLTAPGRYRPVEVEAGPEVDGFVAIRRGVEAGQKVVASGQFLIDSEASLQGLTGRGAAWPAAGSGTAAAGAAANAASAASAATAEHETTATVVELGRDEITLDHAPVPSLKWPAMTMPFKLARPDLARGLKPGDAVRLRFKQEGDEHTVTAIERRGGAPAAATSRPAATAPASAPAARDPHAGHASSPPAASAAAGGQR